MQIIIRIIVVKLRNIEIKHTYKYLSGLYLTRYPHLFQKFSNALTKLERQVPIQGISLMNMAFWGNEFVWHTMIFFAKPNFAHKIIGSRYYFIGVI